MHLYIVADDVWLWVHLRDRQGKHRGNKYVIVTVVAQGQRDALLWADVTLSTSYNKCHEWTWGWTSPMNKCRATGRRKYAFPDPCAIVFFFHVVIRTTTSHNISHLFLATMNKCTELRKYAFPDPCLLEFFWKTQCCTLAGITWFLVWSPRQYQEAHPWSLAWSETQFTWSDNSVQHKFSAEINMHQHHKLNNQLLFKLLKTTVVAQVIYRLLKCKE